MEMNRAIEVVNNAKPIRKFRVTYENGDKKEIRLFISSCGYLCVYKKRSCKVGFPLFESDIEKWKDIYPVKSAEIYLTVKRFMQNVIKYLNESELWPDIKESYEKILAQGDEYLIHVLSLDWSEQRKYMNETIGVTFHVDSIVKSALKGIVSINYERYDKEYIRDKAKKAIQNNETYCYSWRKGYDNSVEFQTCKDGKKRGWYSEEYKNCGNGHYYLAIDERRAIFYEDD